MTSYAKVYNMIEKLKLLGATKVSIKEDDTGDVSCEVEFKADVVVKEEPLDWRKHQEELPDDLFKQMQVEAYEEVAYLSSEGD